MVAREGGISRPAVWRWQQRYDEEGVDRLLRDKTRKPGKAGTMTHDHVRHGTMTLFAAPNMRDGTVIGRRPQRRRHQEPIRFLNAVEAAVPGGLAIHVVLDNYATPKHPKVQPLLARHPNWTFHFTPTSSSWLNAVETFSSAMTGRHLRRGVFRSLVDRQAAINRSLDEHNADAKPFTWTQAPPQSSTNWIK